MTWKTFDDYDADRGSVNGSWLAAFAATFQVGRPGSPIAPHNGNLNGGFRTALLTRTPREPSP